MTIITTVIPPTSSNVAIPEVYSDPISPAAQDAWVLANITTITGTPIGMLLTLTHTTSSITSYQFSYKTIEGVIVRTTLA